jgi:hypothetical protein
VKTSTALIVAGVALAAVYVISRPPAPASPAGTQAVVASFGAAPVPVAVNNPAIAYPDPYKVIADKEAAAIGAQTGGLTFAVPIS